jgi:hypothetical protein
MPKDGEQRSRSPKSKEPERSAAELDMEAKFNEMYKKVIEPEQAKAMSAANEAVYAGVKTLVCTEMQALESRVDAKLADVKSEVSEVKEMVTRIEIALADRPTPAPTYASIAGNGSGSTNSNGNGIPSPPAPFPPSHPASFPRAPPALLTPEDLNQSRFWVPPNKCRLFANTLAGVKVSLEKFKASIEKLADEAALKPDYFTVYGDPLCNRVEILFTGDPESAARRAATLVDSLKLGKAIYKEQSVQAPDNTPTQYFINPDKSLAQVRKEILGKGLFDIICKAKPDLAFNLQRGEATIWCDRKPVCSVKILSESNARISWMPSRQILYGLDKANIEPAFAEVVATRGEVWT